MFERLFVEHPIVLGQYRAAGVAAKDVRSLCVRLVGSRELLEIPLECLFETPEVGAEYVVLRWPMARVVSGVENKRSPLSPTFLRTLWRTGERLRVLLVAANTEPAIPGVDEEVSSLKRLIRARFRERGIAASIETLARQRATVARMKDAVQTGRFHMIHYAGHGHYAGRLHPEKSSLYLWERDDCQGSVVPVAASEFAMWLRASPVRLLYLSSCLGAMSGPPTALRDGDFLGVADAAVHAGVPCVLSYRWSVSDIGAKAIAAEFYERLADHGDPEVALFQARIEAASRNRDDDSWLSPVLVMQEL